jgi:hypothetical protein
MTFQEFVKKYNIIDPYSNIYPDTKYDYVSAWKAGATPTLINGELKWPSQFKHDDSPERWKNGIDTKNFKGDNMANGRLKDVQNLTVNRKLNRFLGGGSLAPDVMEILEKNAKTAGMDRTGGRLGQKPMNLEDELSLADEKSGVDLTTNPEIKAQNHGNTVMDGLIRLDDIQNTQDTTTVEKALKEQLKNPSFANQFKSLIMHTLKNTFGGVPQAAQNIVKSDVQMREGYEQNIPPSDAMIDFGKTVPAFARGVKESMFGEPDPVEFGGKAQTYDEILKGRKYQMGGPIGRKGLDTKNKAIKLFLSQLPIKFKN